MRVRIHGKDARWEEKRVAIIDEIMNRLYIGFVIVVVVYDGKSWYDNNVDSNTKITPDIEVQFKKSKHVDDVVVHNPGCIRYSSK